MAPSVHTFGSTGEAYNASQCRDEIKDGDVLSVPSERVVGVLIGAWPTAISEAAGEFHTPSDDLDFSAVPVTSAYPDETPTKDYSASFEAAVEELDRICLEQATEEEIMEGTEPETITIEIGKSYEFVSEVLEETAPAEVRLRNYTGQQALVLALVEDNDPDNSPLYSVRFPDGREAQAWEEELSGWDKALGQFYGPSGAWGDPS